MAVATRIPLDNTEFEGHNNAYLLQDGSDTALVDTGVDRDVAREPLRAALDDTGVDVADLDAVLLTHWHPDHAGLAGDLQAESGATVYGHPEDAPLIEQRDYALEELRENQERYFEDWEIPDAKRAALRERLAGGGALFGQGADVTTVTEGDEIRIGDLSLRVVHTPGHTAGHICYEYETERGLEAFSGDALLPHYTPNVGGADVRVDRPLAVYVSTLETIRDRGYERVNPGHRAPIEAPDERAEEIVEHHRERTERVLDVVASDGPVDTWSVSQSLFGEVRDIHILHGPGESYAHLDHLTRHGVLAVSDGRYRIEDVPAEQSVAELL
jgi:glyoxylase-like metal-dependent hydrolase (beta-lactamase superfamily II)